MAIRLTLRKADLEILAVMDEIATEGTAPVLSPKQLKAWSSFHERCLAAEMKPKKNKGEGISVRKAIEVFRGVLGRRLVVPAGSPSPGWWAQLQKRLNDSGITEEHAQKAAEIAGANWKGLIKAESIVRQIDTLLSEATISNMGTQLKPEAEDMTDL